MTPKLTLYRIDFAGSGVWDGVKQRFTATVEIDHSTPEGAISLARHTLRGPITTIEHTRITVRKVR